MSIHYTLAEAARMMGIDAPPETADLVMTGVSIDTRTLAPGDLFFALTGERFDGAAFAREAMEKGAVAVVCPAASAPENSLVAPQPLESLQRLAIAHRERCAARIIAITGSCGKTTAKDLCAAVLGSVWPVVKTPGNLNNDIGCPLSLLRIGLDTRFAIIEMGANHSGEIAQLCRMTRPHESTVTMVGPAHLEGFGSIDRVAKAKAEILEGLPEDGCFYVNMDDPRCRAMAENYHGEKVRFGREGDVVLKDLTFGDSGDMVLDIAPAGRLRLPLRVRAHATNVLLAVAVALRHGIKDVEAPLREACRNAARFKTARIGTWTALDDSYNANPSSMKAAIEALMDYPGRTKIATLGTMFELGENAAALHAEVGAFAAERGVDALFALGPHAADMVSGARGAGLNRAFAAENHEDAAAQVAAIASPGDVILVKGSRGMKMEGVLDALRALTRADD